MQLSRCCSPFQDTRHTRSFPVRDYLLEGAKTVSVSFLELSWSTRDVALTTAENVLCTCKVVIEQTRNATLRIIPTKLMVGHRWIPCMWSSRNSHTPSMQAWQLAAHAEVSYPPIAVASDTCSISNTLSSSHASWIPYT